ncbi:hypothetical protein [Nocardioides sp. B-3]|nr:hypothetical protein [Nocardioides sp. B-3]UUZ59655.1 hypothetical protein LP418_00405 [Nocardioides sp. B-3]
MSWTRGLAGRDELWGDGAGQREAVARAADPQGGQQRERGHQHADADQW